MKSSQEKNTLYQSTFSKGGENQLRLLEFCALLEKNDAGEHDAISGYFDLLDKLDLVQDISLSKRKIKEIIEEIISDELNHHIVLGNLIESISGIKAAED